MAQQLSFLEPAPPAGAVPAWETLQAEQQQAVRALLARLMHQLIEARRAARNEGHPDA